MGCLNADTSRAEMTIASSSGPGLSSAEHGTVLKAGLGEGARDCP